MNAASIAASVQPRAPRGAFKNTPFVDFHEPGNARAMRSSLGRVEAELGREYDLVIGGRRHKTASKIQSLNPARPTQVVGIHQKAGAGEAQMAMDAALQAFATWRRTPAEQRASVLLRAAEILRERKFEFS